MRELPVGWEITPIANVLEPKYEGKTIQQGWSPRCEKHPSSCNNTWGVLKTTAIQAGYFIENENKELPEHLTPKEQIEVSEGDILLTCAGPRNRCGVPTLVRKTRPKLMMSGKMYRFRAFEEYFQPSFLELYLLSHEAQLAIDKMKTGSSDSGLNLTHGRFRELLIPVAPFKEQQRIVDKVEELFSELDKGIESLKTAKAQLAVYRQALLKHAFEGKLTEEWRKDNADKLESPEQLLQHIQQEREARYQQQLDDWKQEVEKWEADGKGGKKPQKPRKAQIKQTEALVDDLPNEWAVYSLSEISEHIVDGTHKTPKYVSEGVKFISAKDIFGFRISFENTRFITEEEHKELIKRCNPKKGNVLITKSGTLGRVAVVKDESEFSLFESVANVPVLPPMISEFVSKQVYYVINTGFGASIQKGVAVRHLHLEDLRKLPLSICSVEEQQEICLRLDSEFTLLDSLERELEVNLRKCEVLRQSILKKAFSGQLVSQDPNDEPASELLKKIAIEKAELAEKEKAEKAAARKVKAAKKAKT
ncbi:restriction endonuclease subunit S [Pseudoalteromonas marina]|uniref:Restriction endonuclease subunit S n=1 Tax=Pseudoalteromonas marina TaxID=267375 RepID=A0ABT9FDX9_9GAMM|nr:restriction endonuclease subunit S [Pseudoalteromonas marina]MDP2564973.1 restriction endonuclease subunit S [Pseudoalteromonas marina]